MGAEHRRLARDRISSSLLIGGALIGLVGNALHPHSASTDELAALDAIARNGAWGPIHVSIILAVLMIVGGLAALSRRLADTPGETAVRASLVLAAIGAAVVTTSTAIDGFGMKALALSVADAPAAEAASLLPVVLAIKAVGFGIWSIAVLIFFGGAFGLLGAGLLASGTYPAWVGWLPLAGAAGSTIAAVLQLAYNREVQDAENIFLISSLVLTVWSFALGILLWRDGGVPARAAVAPSHAG